MDFLSYIPAACNGHFFEQDLPAGILVVRIAVVVPQKATAVFIDIPAHGPTIEISHDCVAAAVVDRALERVHRIEIIIRPTRHFTVFISTSAGVNRLFLLPWSNDTPEGDQHQDYPENLAGRPTETVIPSYVRNTFCQSG
jgi:hypothetical protein